ncbi:hypothetical protein BN961_00389 [Afipia felis]|uniref:Uncharacterized protein n=1 Tax=Afipia felis TaxID=1035 RepID=A0A090N6K4_AFIFE|nr:hypothetical protein BN961_00389 [Afipia felis]
MSWSKPLDVVFVPAKGKPIQTLADAARYLRTLRRETRLRKSFLGTKGPF